MLIKLNYTTGNAKWQYQIWRIVNECINNASITSIATLQSIATSQSWATDLLSGLDAANSTIVRTSGLSTSNTKSHIYGAPAGTTTGGVKFTIEFSVYDSLSTKYYYQINTSTYSANTGGSGYGLASYLASAVTGGTIASSGLPITTANGTTTPAGTNLSIGGSYQTAAFSTNSSTQAGPANSIFTAWVYISDTGMMYAFNNSGAATTGFPANSSTANSSAATYWGPFMVSQYTRYDDWNTMANGIYPVIYPGNVLTFQYGWKYDPSMTSLCNGSAGYALFYLFTAPDIAKSYMTQSLSTSGTSAAAARSVNMTIAGRSSGQQALTSSSAVSTANTASYYPIISNTANYKVPNSTLTAASFIQYPIGWEMHIYGFMGGDISEKSGIYLFVGDFSGGDQYTIGSTTYTIWYMFDFVTTIRVGLAVPNQ